jgi:hypothetical protein
MMESNANIFAVENGDENGIPLQQTTSWGPHKHHPSTSYGSKTLPISTQQLQRRPFQTLNTNTSSIGAISDTFRSSSNTTKPQKVRKRFRVGNFRGHILLIGKLRPTSRFGLLTFLFVPTSSELSGFWCT